MVFRSPLGFVFEIAFLQRERLVCVQRSDDCMFESITGSFQTDLG